MGEQEQREGPGFRVERRGDWLLAHFGAQQQFLSWAIVNGGFHRGQTVAWLKVVNADLGIGVDPVRLLAQRLKREEIPDAVGLLTSRKLDAYTDVKRGSHGFEARCLATVGLGNALRAGDQPGRFVEIGTINLLCWVSTPLTQNARIEALALAAEARTAAILQVQIPSSSSQKPATGTGTDCIVLASPAAGKKSAYAGKHTEIGYLVGASVLQAVREGAEQWKAEHGAKLPGMLPE